MNKGKVHEQTTDEQTDRQTGIIKQATQARQACTVDKSLKLLLFADSWMTWRWRRYPSWTTSS
jgi:hypothetical protein